ncbi:hypothetical protein CTheo_5855 [Ceratobasidium theobromae]|uniref:DRBM domain-containing protein n=1 Tax=Ceratobasidium theobromae TaxID=1582974 RepID=A0A5N5QHD8_9AGAM|nr:hypothetical protein CTheo_5855 [Ceratobasidium theobromae]
MAQHFGIWQNWYRQQSMPPPVQWSDSPVTHNGQNMWMSEASVNGRTIGQGMSPSKATAQNECARQLLIYFKVPCS